LLLETDAQRANVRAVSGFQALWKVALAAPEAEAKHDDKRAVRFEHPIVVEIAIAGMPNVVSTIADCIFFDLPRTRESRVRYRTKIPARPFRTGLLV